MSRTRKEITAAGKAILGSELKNIYQPSRHHVIEYDFGDTVYIVHDPTQTERMIVEITLLPNGIVLYTCAYEVHQSEHYAFELTREKDIIKALNYSGGYD
jgi:hypothetical protein